MTSSRIPLALVAAAALAAGCDRLATEPGHDFAVRVLTPTPIRAIGKITVPVEVEVTGCDTFDAEVRVGGASHLLALSRQASGTWRSEVPVEWLREEDRSCLDDARSPRLGRAQLTVACGDTGRTTDALLDVSYGTATRAHRSWAGLSWMRRLFPSDDPLAPYLMTSDRGASSGLQQMGYDAVFLGDRVPELFGSSLVVAGGTVLVSSGCNVPGGCPDMAISESMALQSQALYPYPVETFLHSDGQIGLIGLIGLPPLVPAMVLDMAVAEDGSVVVLSLELDAQTFAPAATIVTRVDPASDPPGVQVIGYFRGEAYPTRLARNAAGDLGFASLVLPESSGPVGSVLHWTNGVEVTSRADIAAPLDLGQWSGSFIYPSPWIDLSPDGSTLRVNGRYLGPPGGPFLAVPGTEGERWLRHDRPWIPVWLPTAVVLWPGVWMGPDVPLLGVDSGEVACFDAAPPHDLRFTYEVHALPGSRAAAQLRDVTSVGDKLVLTTSTGVRILDRDGNLVGGADPLPCGLSPTALAIQSGPTTAAVGAGDYVYVFDLADLP